MPRVCPSCRVSKGSALFSSTHPYSRCIECDNKSAKPDRPKSPDYNLLVPEYDAREKGGSIPTSGSTSRSSSHRETRRDNRKTEMILKESDAMAAFGQAVSQDMEKRNEHRTLAGTSTPDPAYTMGSARPSSRGSSQGHVPVGGGAGASIFGGADSNLDRQQPALGLRPHVPRPAGSAPVDAPIPGNDRRLQSFLPSDRGPIGGGAGPAAAAGAAGGGIFGQDGGHRQAAAGSGGDRGPTGGGSVGTFGQPRSHQQAHSGSRPGSSHSSSGGSSKGKKPSNDQGGFNYWMSSTGSASSSSSYH